jgi:hypothetical protein
MQVTDNTIYYRLAIATTRHGFPATPSRFPQRIGVEHPPRLAKRLRLGVAWANPLKGFEISATVCVDPRMGFTQR